MFIDSCSALLQNILYSTMTVAHWLWLLQKVDDINNNCLQYDIPISYVTLPCQSDILLSQFHQTTTPIFVHCCSDRQVCFAIELIRLCKSWFCSEKRFCKLTHRTQNEMNFIWIERWMSDCIFLTSLPDFSKRVRKHSECNCQCKTDAI